LSQNQPPSNDPLLSNQWGLAAVHASEAWSLIRTTLGGLAPSGVAIGIIDSGVNYNHEDLAANVIRGKDECDDSTGQCLAILAHPLDRLGHGTTVAATAAAIANNGKGGAGIAYNAPIVAVKITTNSGQVIDQLGIAEGILDAISNGAKVINLSIYTSPAPVLTDTINLALSSLHIVVAAVGNANCNTTNYPASLPGVIAVGASDADNNRATWGALKFCTTLFDSGSNYGSRTDVYAPGSGILSYLATANSGSAAYGSGVNGTSFASPFVAGAASLMLAINPSLTPVQVRSIIMQSAQHTSKYDPVGNEIRLLDVNTAVQQAIALLPHSNQPPAAGFLMTSGNQSIHNGPVPLSLNIPRAGSTTVNFNGSAPTYSSDPDGTVISWLWSIDGAQASTAPTFSKALSKGNHQISLFVGDNNGAFGPAAIGLVNIVEETPPQITMSFGASSIVLNANPGTSLTFTVSAPLNPAPLTGVGFNDALPAGLTVSLPNGLTGSCINGTLTAVAGGSTVSLTGVTLLPGASCTFSLNVTGTTSGLKINSVTVTSANGGNGNTATSSVTVSDTTPSVITYDFTGTITSRIVSGMPDPYGIASGIISGTVSYQYPPPPGGSATPPIALYPNMVTAMSVLVNGVQLKAVFPGLQNFGAVQTNYLQLTHANGASSNPFSYASANMSIILQAPTAVLPNLSFPALIDLSQFTTKRFDLTISGSGGGIFNIDATLSSFTKRTGNSQPRYSVTAVPIALGLTSLVLGGISQDGRITGTAFTGSQRVPFVGNQTGIATIAIPTNWIATSVYGINTSGQICGNTSINFVTQAFTGNSGGLATIPLPPGFFSSSCAGINNTGQIAGNGNGGSRAFIVTGGAVTPFPIPSGWQNISASGINSAGQIAGTLNVCCFREQGYIGTAAGITPIPLPSGWLNSEAEVINDSGVVAGSVMNDFSGTLAQVFVGSSSSVSVISIPGYTFNAAIGINNLGQVLILARNSSDSAWVLWDAVNGARFLRDLIPSGWEVDPVIGINDNGQVLGWGRNSPTADFVPVVLNPVQ
jgi:hypothetical protein